MARLNLPSPTAYTGQPATIHQSGAARFATPAEVAAGVMTNVAVSPADLTAQSAADLSAPTPIGDVTPNTGAFTTLSATGLTTLAALTQVGTASINASGAGVTTIGTGGTGAVNIGNATGNTAVTGSLTASTTLTATLGAITATNGNVVLSTAGNKLIIATGANASVGTSDAMTDGVVAVATTASSATAKIFYARATTGGTTGDVSITAQDGTGFTLTSSSNTETSTFNWWIINA